MSQLLESIDEGSGTQARAAFMTVHAAANVESPALRSPCCFAAHVQGPTDSNRDPSQSFGCDCELAAAMLTEGERL